MTTLMKLLRHRAMIKVALGNICREMDARADLHDLSKLRMDEFDGFAALDRATSDQRYGTDEQQQTMAKHSAVVDLHYSRNEHHPEHHSPGDMGWLDIVEMVCDWWAAWIVYDAEKPDDAKTTWANVLRRQRERFSDDLSPFQMVLAMEVAEWLEPYEELPAVDAPEAPAATASLGIVQRNEENQVACVLVPGMLSVEEMVDRVQQLTGVAPTRTALMHYRLLEWKDGYPMASPGHHEKCIECTVYDPGGIYSGATAGRLGTVWTQRELQAISKAEARSDGDKEEVADGESDV